MEVFFTSPWIPAEWIEAHGLVPRGAWPTGPVQALPVSAGVCAYAQRFRQFAETQPDAAVVFATTCDQMRRAFDAGAPAHRRWFLFNVPTVWQSPVARQMYRAEIERLGRFFVGLGGATPAGTRLADIMRARDQVRARLRAAHPRLAAHDAAAAVARFHREGRFDPPSPPAAAPVGGVPVALVGGPLDSGPWPVLDAIEAAGGRIVVNGTEPGERSLLPQFGSFAAGGALDALVDGYLGRHVDVFQRPNTSLYDWLGRRLCESAARGLVLWSWSACDLWRAEAESLRGSFGLPVLLLEADDAQGVSLRERGRLQAFLEMLR